MSETTSPDAAPDTEATEAGEPAAPSDELREGLLATFTDALGDRVRGSHIQPGQELWVRVDRSAWVEAAQLAKDRLGCTFFDFLSAIDWMVSPWGRYEDALVDNPDPDPDPDQAAAAPAPGPDGTPDGAPATTTALATGVTGGETRFQVLCRLVDVRRHHSVILVADVGNGTGTTDDADDLRIASLVPLFAGANWHERECWEMFGIVFEGHPGLRHLYLPGAFEGHPLRKDFPLVSRMIKPWPGIVDVEPMPEQAGSAEDEGASASEEEPTP
jgi:NADH-quinone oxidoreductase subunit C